MRRSLCRCAQVSVANGAPAAQKEGYLRGEHPLGTSLPPFFVKRKEGPCRGLSDRLHIVSKADLWAIVLFFVATLRKRLGL